VLTGIDSQFYASVCVGARCIFSTAACVIPREMVRIWDAAQRGDHQAAHAAHERVQPVNRFLEYDPGYVAPCKAALEIIGVAAGVPTRPLPRLTPAELEALRAALGDLGYVR
jgi:dihydrodipicolinate synthase/N-acetylneuraminate lyase